MSRAKILRVASRSLAAILIAAAFLVILAAASAQQEAVRALEQTSTGLSFSVARRTFDEAASARKEQQRLLQTNTRLRSLNRQLEAQRKQRERTLFTRLEDVDLLARSIVRWGGCEALGPQAKLGDTPDLRLWRLVQACAKQQDFPAQFSSDVRALRDPDAEPGALQQSIEVTDADIKGNGDAITFNESEIERLKGSISNADKVSNAPQDLEVLDAHPILGLFDLTSIPPRILQILLSFASGVFGALLLTLILLVYPDNALKMEPSESYWSRILLGGLIALGLYVILGGGIAMIGSTDAVAGADTNFMFFCAIGILAGMFSDRVAGFLSDRADVFAPRYQGGKVDGTGDQPSSKDPEGENR